MLKNVKKLHTPVLAKEVLNLLNLKNGQTIIDATLGAGGHSLLILEKIIPDGKLIGLDWDERNIKIAEINLQKYKKNCIIIRNNFIEIKKIFTELNNNQKYKIEKIDGILFDFGVSSMHFDNAERGFAFKKEGPLDMRFSKETKLTAYDIINKFTEYDLAKILKEYGEIRNSKKIARHIIDNRKKEKITTTIHLAEIIREIEKHNAKNTLSKIFQALRIEVNNELGNIKQGLLDSLTILNKNGIIITISFHSLEDRIAKNIFREVARKCSCPKEALRCTCNRKAKFKKKTKKPIFPTEEEIKINPRSRSARLRAIQKL